MYQMNPEIEFLYSFEDTVLYGERCDYIFNKYAPKNAEETSLVSHIAIATWKRKRAAETMHSVMRQIEAERQKERPDYGLIARLARSVVRFQREYRSQQKAIAGCRKALWMLRVLGKSTDLATIEEEMTNVRLAA